MNTIQVFLNSGLSNETEMTKANGYIIALPTNGVFKLDETLDEANFEFYSSTISENIKPFTRFKIVKTQGTNITTNYYYGYSEVESVNLSKGIHKHFVYLIEPTKILERHILGARYFSKDSSYFTSYEDLVNLILETCYTYSTEESETTPIDNLYFDTQSDDRLEVEAREFQFSDTTTLFEALEEIALSINAYPRLVDFDKIVFDFFEDGEEKSIDSYKVFNKKEKQDLNRYSTSLFSAIKNVVSGEELSNIKMFGGKGLSSGNMGVSERTETIRLTEDTAFLQTEYPIYKIKKLVLVGGRLDDTPDSDGFINTLLFENASSSEVVPSISIFDITDFVFERKQWDLFEDDLDNPDAWETVFNQTTGELTGDNSKLCSLFFKEGDNKIENLYKYNSFFFNLIPTRFALFNILTVKEKLANKLTLPFNDFSNGITPMFQIVYETMLPHTVKQYRNKWEDFGDKENSIIYNQSGNLIDFELFGENIKGKIKRMGNKRYEVAFIASDYVDIQIGDKIGEYVVTEKSVETYRRFEKVLLKLDKNFNRKSNDVSVESQKRLFQIADDNFTVERFINRQLFLTFDTEERTDNLWAWRNTWNEYMALNFTTREKDALGNIDDIDIKNQRLELFSFYENDSSSKRFWRTPILYTSQNALLLSVQFDDIRQHYFSTKIKDDDPSKRLNTERIPNYYTNDNGELTSFRFTIYDKFEVGYSNYVDNHDFAYKYPQVLRSGENVIYDDVLRVKKDVREILKFNFQFNFLSGNKNIVLTNNFAKNNYMYYYTANSSNKDVDNIKIQPLSTIESDKYLTYDITKGVAETLTDGETTSGFSCIYNKDDSKLEINVPESWKTSKEAFAFIDSEDNVIMIVNDLDIENIHMNFSHRY